MSCESRYKSPINATIAACSLKGYHTAHRGDGYVWWDSDAVKPAPAPVVEKKPKEKVVEPEKSVRETQVGGDHYGGDLQPIDVIDAWGLDFYEGSALKCLARHRKKNGREDIEKAIHYLELLLERQYKNV